MGLTEYGDREGQYLFPGNHGANFSMSGNSLFSAAPDEIVPPPLPPKPPSPPAPPPVPAPPVEPPSNLSTITARVSGDSYQGFPAFSILVDGKLVASDIVAIAVHCSGQWADVTIAGDFAKAPDRVAIMFTNDLWADTEGDRNLYVDHIDVNGRRFEGEQALSNTANPTQFSSPTAALMLTNGTVTFDTSYAPPVETAPAQPSGPVPLNHSTPKIIKGTNRANTLVGSSDQDLISGLGGADKLKAGAGHDVLSGGRDRDLLWGGGGDDTFRFGATRESHSRARDVIYDWDNGATGRGDDLMDVHSIDANVSRSGNQAFKWIGKAAFSGKAGELRAYFDGADTIVKGNVDGDKYAEFQVRIIGKHALNAADFVL
jgi:hypothetical protein